MRKVNGGPVRLSAGGGDKLWQHVATGGQYDGYGDGDRPFEFTRRTFDQIVANFRKHPAYGKGGGVVPWDVGHSSEVPAAERTIAGSAAVGWVHELEVRDGPSGPELWALTSWLPEMSGRIRSGQFQWASVAVLLDAIDPKSGASIGPELTSIAVTNQPFITNLTPLAASRTTALGGAPRTMTTNPIREAVLACEGGPNVYAQAMNYLAQTDPAHAKLTYDQRFDGARKLVADLGLKIDQIRAVEGEHAQVKKFREAANAALLRRPYDPPASPQQQDPESFFQYRQQIDQAQDAAAQNLREYNDLVNRRAQDEKEKWVGFVTGNHPCESHMTSAEFESALVGIMSIVNRARGNRGAPPLADEVARVRRMALDSVLNDYLERGVISSADVEAWLIKVIDLSSKESKPLPPPPPSARPAHDYANPHASRSGRPLLDITNDPGGKGAVVTRIMAALRRAEPTLEKAPFDVVFDRAVAIKRGAGTYEVWPPGEVD